MHEGGYRSFYFTKKERKKAYRCICWKRETEGEKRGFGRLSSQSDVSQWGECWADVPASPTAPSVWLTEVDNASLDLPVFFMPAIFGLSSLTQTQAYTYIYFVKTLYNNRRTLFYLFVQSVRHRSQRALESVDFVCVVMANVYTTWEMLLFSVILQYVNITKTSICSVSKRPRRERGSIQPLRTESQFVAVPAKAGTHKTPLGWLLTLVNTTDLLTSALSYRIYAKVQKLYLPFLTCSYQSSSTENRQQSRVFIKQLLLL